MVYESVGEDACPYGGETARELAVVRAVVERRLVVLVVVLVAAELPVVIVMVMKRGRLVLGPRLRPAPDTWHEAVHEVREAPVRLAHDRHPVNHVDLLPRIHFSDPRVMFPCSPNQHLFQHDRARTNAPHRVTLSMRNTTL